MAAPPYCPSCHAVLSDAAVEGLCPACLLTQVLDSPPHPDFAPGTTFGPFRIERLLGKGGMSIVYEARETALDRLVALKVLPPELLHNDTFASRFTQEAQLAGRLEHPNIVPIFSSGIDEGIPWMSMRLLDGGTLAGLINPDGLDITRTTNILRSVAEALDHAHSCGVVHRDLKPSNILLDRSDRAYIGDFGLAFLTEGREGLTRSGTILGTPHYMAPEQVLGRRVDYRCDLYSLGVVAYEMLTGTTPFRGSSAIAILMQHVNDPVPVPPRALVSEQQFSALKKALAKKPENRWSSAVECLNALESGVRVFPPFQVVVRWALRSTAFAVAIALLWLAITLPRDDGETSSERTTQDSIAADVKPSDERKPDPLPPAQPTPSDDGVVRKPSKTAPADTRPTRTTDDPKSPVAPSQTDSSTQPAATPETGDSKNAGTPERSVEEVSVSPPIVPHPVPEPPGDVITEPLRIKTVKPDYPRNAKSVKAEGDVLVEAVILPDGRPTKVRVVSSPNPALNDAAIRAVQQSTYKPGLRNGVPDTFTIQVTVKFDLR